MTPSRAWFQMLADSDMLAICMVPDKMFNPIVLVDIRTDIVDIN